MRGMLFGIITFLGYMLVYRPKQLFFSILIILILGNLLANRNRKDNTRPEDYLDLGYLYERQGNYSLAERYYVRAIEKGDENAKRALANLLEQNAKTDTQKKSLSEQVQDPLTYGHGQQNGRPIKHADLFGDTLTH